jgi:hypothetical protein
MNYLNTAPIENFLDKARIAIKSNQRNLTLDIKEVQSLVDSLAVTMTRLAGDVPSRPPENTAVQVKMDGGNF